MARPVQLRYNDATDGETIIGTYLTDDNLINDGMLKNSGSGEFTRLEIVGDKQIQEKIETDYTNYGNAQNGESEPEILVYTYEASTDSFKLRDRVFPEDAGKIKDDGTYRNNSLWGFQKWVGRQRVSGISLSSATITDIVDALLPSGYVAQTPSGDSVPTVDNYSYTGSINGALRDIIRDYPVKIWFTADLDGNNDYIVKVQSKGFGGVIQTITFDDERQTEGYQINEFEPEDKSNIVNKVEIIGKANDGSKIQVTETDSTSINQHGERYIKRHVGYIENSTQATDLANSILSPDPSPHAEIAIPFQESNQLNGSVDILDDRYGIDAIYTIVKQRDFFTEGRTEVELGFEKNRTEKRRNANRDLDERNNQLFPTDQTDVGNQNADLDTGSAPSDTAVNGSVDQDPSDTSISGDVDQDPSDTSLAGTLDDEGANNLNSPFNTGYNDTTISEGSWNTVSGTSVNTGNLTTALIYTGYFQFEYTETSSGASRSLVAKVRLENTDKNEFYPSSSGYIIHAGIRDNGNNNIFLKNQPFNLTIVLSQDSGLDFNWTNDDVELQVFLEDNTTINASAEEVDGFLHTFEGHTHGDSYNTNDNNHGHGDSFATTDNNHGHGDSFATSDNSHGGTGDATGQHGASGTTDSKNVDITQEDKTDRS